MAFTNPKNKHAVASKILKLLGYNNFKELADNVGVCDGSPNGTVANTGIQGAQLVLNINASTGVYIRTGWNTTSSTYYLRIV